MSSRARVLVADDDPDILASVGDALTLLGADVVRAESGAELVDRLAHAGPFSLIVTDVSMPWMTGLQAVQTARASGLGADVIVMTALRDERIPDQVRALGERAVLLRKPFELGELQSAVKGLLSSR